MYRSSFDASELIQAAQQELAQDDPAAFLVVLLGLCLGLRKGEIDLLPWSAVKFESALVRIEPTDYFEVKTEHSIGDVPVDAEVLEILRGFKARAKSPFVVPSRLVPRRTTSYHHYRCEPIFDRVLVWLKGHGVNARKPLHALRKEYGSLINEKYDLVTAKELLRHSSVATTAAHYVENRKRGTTGLGALLRTKRKGKKIVQFKDAQAKPPATSGKFDRRARRVKTRNPAALRPEICSVRAGRRAECSFPFSLIFEGSRWAGFANTGSGT